MRLRVQRSIDVEHAPVTGQSRWTRCANARFLTRAPRRLIWRVAERRAGGPPAADALPQPQALLGIAPEPGAFSPGPPSPEELLWRAGALRRMRSRWEPSSS